MCLCVCVSLSVYICLCAWLCLCVVHVLVCVCVCVLLSRERRDRVSKAGTQHRAEILGKQSFGLCLRPSAEYAVWPQGSHSTLCLIRFLKNKGFERRPEVVLQKHEGLMKLSGGT